ncbi:hypothetical protein V6O07_22825 [Arthrospira platensis SPKY2]
MEVGELYEPNDGPKDSYEQLIDRTSLIESLIEQEIEQEIKRKEKKRKGNKRKKRRIHSLELLRSRKRSLEVASSEKSKMFS